MEAISIFDYIEKSKKTIFVSGSKTKPHYRTIEVSDDIDEQNKQKNKSNDNTGEARLDNRRTVGSSSLRELVGSGSQGERIERTLYTSNSKRGSRTTSEGVQERWDKALFKQRLEKNAKVNSAWIDDIRSVVDNSIKFEWGYENETYLSNDGNHVIKLNNLFFLNDSDM